MERCIRERRGIYLTVLDLRESMQIPEEEWKTLRFAISVVDMFNCAGIVLLWWYSMTFVPYHMYLVSSSLSTPPCTATVREEF